MKTIIHKAESRGHANLGWLDTHHTFSFSNYYNPERMNFGVLRVLNDDRIAGGTGFGKHPHDNMEIISIPLEGALEHEDSMGNKAVIQAGDIQVMSAGTGVYHSEYNHNQELDGSFLQIWMFPNKRQVEPRYHQITLNEKAMHNQFLQILSPLKEDDGVWVYQDAWFHMTNLDANQELQYILKNPTKNGLYIFIIDGDLVVNDTTFNKRDGIGIWETNQVKLKGETNTKVLLMEVPMAM